MLRVLEVSPSQGGAETASEEAVINGYIYIYIYNIYIYIYMYYYYY